MQESDFVFAALVRSFGLIAGVLAIVLIGLLAAPLVSIASIGTQITERISWEQDTIPHEPQVLGPAVARPVVGSAADGPSVRMPSTPASFAAAT